MVRGAKGRNAQPIVSPQPQKENPAPHVMGVRSGIKCHMGDLLGYLTTTVPVICGWIEQKYW